LDPSVVMQTLVVVEMDVIHPLRVGEPSAGDELHGSGDLWDATGTGLDGLGPS
jgi:hypothetical protein